MKRNVAVVIEIVEDETTDVNALLDEIDEANATLDVRGYRFTGQVFTGKRELQ